MAGPNDATGNIELVSTAADGTPANDDTYIGGFSPDGAKVILYSYATNLVPGLTLGVGLKRVYVKDLTTGNVTLISAATANDQQYTSIGFTSDSGSLIYSNIYGLNNGNSDLFQENLATGEVTRINTSVTGADPNNISYNFQLSPDGHRLAFASVATNLVAGYQSSTVNVFVTDLNTGAITRISTASNGDDLNGTYLAGTYVLRWNANKLFFISDATNAVSNDTNGVADLFVKDLTTGVVSRISDAPDGTQANGGVTAFSVSADGSKVAFYSDASNLVAGDTNGVSDLFVKDLTTGAITRVTTNAEGGQSGPGEFDKQLSPVFSPDGTKLMFASFSSDLVPGDTNGGDDIFIKDLVTGSLARVSTASDGSQGTFQNLADDYFAYSGSFSADGSEIGFSSQASGLVPGYQPPGYVEAYVRVLHPAPTTEADNYVASYSAAFQVDAAHGVLANDTSTDNKATLTVTSFSDAKHGRVDMNPDGSFTYTPDGTFIGVDSFTYEASGGYKASADTTVSITVNGNIERVDTLADGSQAASGVFPRTSVLSPDGASVAFVTQSSDLAPNPYLAASQVVLKNLATGALTLVSGPEGGDNPVFSPDGTKVAYTDGTGNIFVKDLVSGAATLVSTAAGGIDGVGSSSNPVFSPDGGSILFESTSPNLVLGGTSYLQADLFVKNLTTGAVIRVSTAANGAAADNALAASQNLASFSPDGKWVVFSSLADNLVAGDTNKKLDIFAKNLATGAVIVVSTASDGAQANGDSITPVFSPDGKSVAFQSDASNLVAGDTNNAPDIFIKNLETGAVTRVSTDANGEQATLTATGIIGYPVFSPDGTRIAFVSSATNLVPGATSNNGSVYEKNLLTGAIRLVSADSFGTQGSGWSTNPTYSADGTKISFSSFASNLVPGDTNGEADVFVKDLTKFPIGSPLADKAPVANADAYDVTENTSLVVAASTGVLANDTDADSPKLSAILPTSPGHGVLAFNADGSFTYTPDAGYVGADSFTYQASDGLLKSDPAVVSLTVRATTTGQVADGYVTGATVFIDTNGNGALDPGEAFSGTDDNGRFTLPAEAGTLVATGGYDAALKLQFLATLSAPSGSTVITPLTTLIVALQAQGVTDAETQAKTAFGLDPTIDLTTLDPVSATSNGAAQGAAVFLAGTQVMDTLVDVASFLGGVAGPPQPLYANALNAIAQIFAGGGAFNLSDPTTITAIIDAGLHGAAADATAINGASTIIASLNSAAAADAALTGVDALVALSAVALTAQGAVSQTLVVAGQQPSQIAIAVHDYTGPLLAQTIEANKGQLGDVDGPQKNNAPVATADHYAATENTPLTVTADLGVLANDTDADANPLTAILATGPQHGALTLNADGSFTYVGSADYIGADAFSYQASDGLLTSNTVTVSLTLAPVDTTPIPVAKDDSFTLDENKPLTITLAQLFANDLNIEADSSFFASTVPGPQHGVLSGNPDGSLVYTPDQGYTGADSFTYTVTNGTHQSNAATVFLTVDVPCFCSGAAIAAAHGPVAVEDLQIGDLVQTVSGPIRPIKWIGRRKVATQFADPIRSWPIRIKAGALDEAVPARDLLLSPDHALLIDDVLIQAGALVNGTSIVRETDVPEVFTYYHVELDDHSLILAENTPAETFIDNVDRLGFDNWAEHEALYPEGKPIDEMPYPRAKAHRQVPMHIRAALDARAKEICAENVLAVA